MELVFELGQPLDDLIPLPGRNGYVLLRKNKLFLHMPSQSEKTERFTSAGVIQHGNKGSFGKGEPRTSLNPHFVLAVTYSVPRNVPWKGRLCLHQHHADVAVCWGRDKDLF